MRVPKGAAPKDLSNPPERLDRNLLIRGHDPMLRLVHPAPKGQEKHARKPRNRSYLTPTPEEQKRIHAAIRNIARAYGGRDVLSEVMGVCPKSLLGRRTRSYSFAYLLARAAGIPVDQLLSGQPHVVGACALCGRKGAR